MPARHLGASHVASRLNQANPPDSQLAELRKTPEARRLSVGHVQKNFAPFEPGRVPGRALDVARAPRHFVGRVIGRGALVAA